MLLAVVPKRLIYWFLLILILTACDPVAPLPRETMPTPAGEARIERTADALPAEMQRGLESAVEQAARAQNRDVADPRWQDVDLLRVVIAGDWALAEAVHEYQYRQPSPFQAATNHPYRLHYLRREKVDWQVVDKREVPGDVQRTLWGPEDELCTRFICLIYRVFDRPYVAEAKTGLDDFAQVVAADFDISLSVREPLTIHIVALDTEMWLEEDGYKTFSPLSLPGVYFEERGISVGAFLRRGVMETLISLLIARAVGPEQTRERWPCAVEGLAQWEVEAAGSQVDKRELRNTRTVLRRDREKAAWRTAAELLDPTHLLPCSGGMDQRLLFYTFLHERYERHSFGDLLRIFYSTDDPAEVSRQALGVDVGTLQSAWEIWLEQQRQQEAYQAAQTLVRFFALLHQGEYAAAADLYAGDYAQLRAWNPQVPAADVATLWKRGCQENGLVCLPVQELFLYQGEEGRYTFVISFGESQWPPFELGREGEAPFSGQWQFLYQVARTAKGLGVLDLPVKTDPSDREQSGRS